jgi:hypothetical protein
MDLNLTMEKTNDVILTLKFELVVGDRTIIEDDRSYNEGNSVALVAKLDSEFLPDSVVSSYHFKGKDLFKIMVYDSECFGKIFDEIREQLFQFFRDHKKEIEDYIETGIWNK